MTAAIARPQGARLIHPDGAVTPLELTYLGVDEDGFHVWESFSAYDPGRDTLEVERMPGRTAINFPTPKTPQAGDPSPTTRRPAGTRRASRPTRDRELAIGLGLYLAVVLVAFLVKGLS